MQVTLAIPKALTSLPQWVVWRLEETADGKPTKIPYTAARPYAKASTTIADSTATKPILPAS